MGKRPRGEKTGMEKYEEEKTGGKRPKGEKPGWNKPGGKVPVTVTVTHVIF